ncbi:hypothetical protein TOPH_05025 [Tolypocladium ophioglossoides CBS 100239]|uniref:Uncharacterized protein n=1 Tax=Tolypocladium ophioglossoides (strain CBS 100239) TaxID=1163406 RepID=A0A0L0N8I4_TOLOC|nr:hypothetical protein TOPH_05025 [Tolypocladium ophioglossoides CBS 100239]
MSSATNHSAEAILPSEPGTDKHLSPGQLLPTPDTLIELREKFLSALDVDSILESQSHPWYYIHRDLGNPDPSRAPIGPIPGNDFHATDPRITVHLPAWGSKLQFDVSGQKNQAGPRLLVIPFKHISDHPDPGPDGIKKVEESAELIRALWPDASVGRSRRRHVGKPVADCTAPEYYIFHWLASKQLNGEGVAMRPRSLAPSGRFAGSDNSDSYTGIGDWSDGQLKDAPTPPSSSYTRLHGQPFSFAQICILCLLSNPNKQNPIQGPGAQESVLDKFADRDVSWCLDSLHGFCRQSTPGQSSSYLTEEKSLSFTLGTSSDCWMYLHFVFHFYAFDPDGPPSEMDAGDSGMQVDRGYFTVPIEFGHKSRDMAFTQRRTWIGMRVATEYRGETPDASPSVVGVVLTDTGHYGLNATDKAWDERGLHSPASASGVALFQMVLWTSLDYWETCWNRCLDFVEQTFKIRLESQGDMDQLQKLVSDSEFRSSKTCTRISMLLSSFRSHINLVAESVRTMEDEWARTYSGKYSERLERFDVDTQDALLENWTRILSHLDEVRGRLHSRIQGSIDELKNMQQGVFVNAIIRLNLDSE